MRVKKSIGKMLAAAMLLCAFNSPHAQPNDTLINYVVNRVAAQQVTNDDFFITGIFPSYISRRQRFSTKKKDNNIFYNGLIAYTLRNIKPALNNAGQQITGNINNRELPLYRQFKNSKGRNTYNFWRTDSAYTFPYTWWIHLLRGNTALPDDMDDTVLGLLAQNSDSTVAAQLHALMQWYTNTDTANKKSIEKKYRGYKAYSTWFGKKFPIVFDVCVLSNILSFVQEYNLPWAAADSASLQVITAAVANNDIITRPRFISPYYGRTSIILYHLARLMHIKKIPALENIKPRLRDEALQVFNQTGNVLEKIILASALIKWGYQPPAIILPLQNEVAKQIEQNPMPFFIGNIPSYFSNGLKKFFVNNNIGLFYHYCPAYNDALLLEYLVLKNN